MLWVGSLARSPILGGFLLEQGHFLLNFASLFCSVSIFSGVFHGKKYVCKFLQSILKVHQLLVDWLSRDPSYCLTGTTTTTVDNIKQRWTKFDFFQYFQLFDFFDSLSQSTQCPFQPIPNTLDTTFYCVQLFSVCT